MSRPGDLSSERRRALFDRILTPGYYFMDVGMLAGIKERVERATLFTIP